MGFLGRACDECGLSSRVVADLVVDVGTGVPIRTDMLGVCCRGDRALWHYPWRVDGPEAPYEMPAYGWMGFRSATGNGLQTGLISAGIEACPDKWNIVG